MLGLKEQKEANLNSPNLEWFPSKNLPSAATTASSVEEFRDTLGNLTPAQFLTV
jgi:hypothetical protein